MGYSWNKEMTIDDQWQSWQDNTDLSKVPDIDTETLKQTIIKDLTFVSAMTVQEYTLYQKFQEVKFRYLPRYLLVSSSRSKDLIPRI